MLSWRVLKTAGQLWNLQGREKNSCLATFNLSRGAKQVVSLLYVAGLEVYLHWLLQGDSESSGKVAGRSPAQLAIQKTNFDYPRRWF